MESSVKEQLLYPVTCPKFYVKLISADLSMNKEIIGKIDPYAYYEYGAQKIKSGTVKNQGPMPIWQN